LKHGVINLDKRNIIQKYIIPNIRYMLVAWSYFEACRRKTINLFERIVFTKCIHCEFCVQYLFLMVLPQTLSSARRIYIP
jgi:hypothetical protein